MPGPTQEQIEAAGNAVIAILSKCSDVDIAAGTAWMFQSPVNAEAKKLRDDIGRAALAAAAAATPEKRREE